MTEISEASRRFLKSIMWILLFLGSIQDKNMPQKTNSTVKVDYKLHSLSIWQIFHVRRYQNHHFHGYSLCSFVLPYVCVSVLKIYSTNLGDALNLSSRSQLSITVFSVSVILRSLVFVCLETGLRKKSVSCHTGLAANELQQAVSTVK